MSSIFFLHYILSYCMQGSFVFICWTIVSDYDCWLQTDLSKRHSHCISHQWFSHTWGCQACKVYLYSSAFGNFQLVKKKVFWPTGSCRATPFTMTMIHFRKQVKTLGKYFAFSFFWGFFQWFYTAGDDCGFKNFPTLGLEAYKHRWELWQIQYQWCL